MISSAFLSMWLSNTSTAAMVMPIVEAVAQQIISAEAEVDAIEMTYANGATNHALELDGTHQCLFSFFCIHPHLHFGRDKPVKLGPLIEKRLLIFPPRKY